MMAKKLVAAAIPFLVIVSLSCLGTLSNGILFVQDDEIKVQVPQLQPLKKRMFRSATQEDMVLHCNFSTFFGGQGNEHTIDAAAVDVAGVATDSTGNVIITGRTDSSDLPVKNGYQDSLAGDRDAFVAKFSAAGDLLYSSYLGGSYDDWGVNVAVDSSDNFVIIGTTASTDFPVEKAYQSENAGGSGFGGLDVFITKFSADGQTLLFSTYLGGNGEDWGYGIDIDTSGKIAVTGSTYSQDFPLKNAYQQAKSNSYSVSAYITVLNADGQDLFFSTYLGGSNANDWGSDVAFDTDNNVLITGGAMSSDFPVKNTFQETVEGGYDSTVVKFSSDGSLVFSTLLGGTGNEYGKALAIDGSNNIVITGSTTSTNYPVKNAYQVENGGNNDAFITKLTSSGQLVFSTYLGGSSADGGTDVAVNSNYIVFAGSSESDDYPTLKAYQANRSDLSDAVVTAISNDGQKILFSTYIGGNSVDTGLGLANGLSTTIFVMGRTRSDNFPIKSAYQENKSDQYDYFISSFTIENLTKINASQGFDFSLVVTGMVTAAVIFGSKRKKK